MVRVWARAWVRAWTLRARRGHPIDRAAAQLAALVKAGVRVLVSGATATLIVVSAIFVRVAVTFVVLRVTISFVLLVEGSALFVVLVLRR